MERPKRKQINVRVDDESEARLNRLVDTASAALGLNLSQSDVIRLALIALEEKYAADTKKPSGAKKGDKK